MTAAAAWAGIIVADLALSAAWYADVLGVAVADAGAGWVAFRLEGGGMIELYGGDRDRPGLVFPSYGADDGPPVMPGFCVEDPAEAADGLPVMRALPDWVVVAAPDGLRLVLTDRDCEPCRGLVGFAFASPDPGALRGFLARVGLQAEVEPARRHAVVPVIVADREEILQDPDGTAVRLVCSPPLSSPAP